MQIKEGRIFFQNFFGARCTN